MLGLLHGLAVVGTVLLLLAVLRKCNDIISIQEATMAQIDDAATANAAKVDALEGKVNETIVTLQELKVLVGTGNTSNAEAILAATGAKLDILLANLGAAETDADPTPDA